MVSVENLTKSFGTHLLFNETSFKINTREKVGLVGRNGHGKTTLFRLITGEERPDAGTITLPKQYRVGYVRQQLEFTEDTILNECVTALPVMEQDQHWKVEKILAGLGFSNDDLQRHPEEFSGGFQVRLNLAKVLISEPDLLLLDEPTNYLDITSIRWVERFLSSWPRELMLITHDRGFMDKLVTHTLGVHRKKTRKIVGNTEKYYAQIAQDEEIYEKTRIKDERRRKDVEQFITRFRAKARLANLVQSRVKTLAKMEKREKLEKLKTLDFSFQSSPFKGKYPVRVQHLRFSYDQKVPLIKDFNITVGSRERICVIGKNGKGKTTLLKLLAGVLQPQGGNIRWHPAVSRGFFEQSNIKNLVDSRTVEEEILFSHPDVDRQLARNVCGAMLFSGDDALKKISVLSGGEKSRVMLGKLLVTPVNVLLLDEPTNHFDMESCDAMLAAIDNFNGTVIMVTHNEMFLHTLAERLIVFQHNRISVFEGSYQRFLEKNGWKDESGSGENTAEDVDEAGPRSKPTRKDLKRRRSEFVVERARVLKPLEKQISKAENDIENLEKKLDRLNAAMMTASQAGDGEQIAAISKSIHHCRSAIDRLFDELEVSTHRFEEQKIKFEKQWEQHESDNWNEQ